MKNLVKYGLVGIAGYMIGFYEMKYKIMKVLLKIMSEEADQEDEAQK